MDHGTGDGLCAVPVAAVWRSDVMLHRVLAIQFTFAIALLGGPQSSEFAGVTQQARAGEASIELWGQTLTDHVDENGLVDYSAVKNDTRFHEYVQLLAVTNPAELADDHARLAFWINAYNALAIHGVLRTLPENKSDWPAYSVLDVTAGGITKRGKGFFRGLKFVVGGREYSLDEIEQAVLLQRPEWVSKNGAFYATVGPGKSDPRVHFALVCCAKGCPKLRQESYQASVIDSQLDDAVRRFLQDATRVRFDRKRRRLEVSQLLDWYGKDLTDSRMSPHEKSVVKFFSKYVSDGELARSLSQESWKTTYIDYDWTLNLKR